MDTVAQLALAAKVLRIFDQPGTYLCFPCVTPVDYPAEHLNFTSLSSSEQLTAFAEVCRLVNSCPAGVVFQPAQPQFLWDQYQAILKGAVLADGDLTPDEQYALSAARTLLYVVDATGTPSASPAVAAYERCRSLWFRATQAYTAAKLSVGSSAAAQTQWTQTDEPALRAQVTAAEADWDTTGQRASVEAARAVEIACAQQSPALQWANWSAQFNPDIDMMTDPQNDSFAISGFTPADFWSDPAWPTLALTADEIAQFAPQAPGALSAALGSPGLHSSTASVSLEYCSVALDRPWFHPEVFESRFWRFADGRTQLSDGGSPPVGAWPAYIAAVVFARNITSQAATVPTPSAAPAPPPPVLRRPFPLGGEGGMPRPAPPGSALPFRPIIVSRLAQNEAPALAHPVIRPPLPPVMHAAAGPIAAAVAARPPAVAPAPAAASPTPAATAQTQPAKTTDQNISILAFVCKSLPKSPDPDLSLTWGAQAQPAKAPAGAAVPTSQATPHPQAQPAL